MTERRSNQTSAARKPAKEVRARRKKVGEQALRDSEELLQRATSAETVGVLFFRLDGRITGANAAFQRMTGYSIDELRAITHWDLLTPPEFMEATRRAAVGLAESGRADPYEKQFIRKDGSRFWGLFAPTRLSGEGMDAVCVEFIIDVSDGKAADAALVESQKQQAFLLEVSDALRAEPDADAIAIRALRMLRDALRLDRCYVGVYWLAEDRGDLGPQVGNDRVPPVPGVVRLSDFPEAMRAASGATLAFDDVTTEAGLNDADRRNLRALGIRGLVVASLREGPGRPLWSIVAISADPRRWTRGEVALVEQVAERTWAAVERARAAEALRAHSDRQALLLQLADALRPLADPIASQVEATRVLGRHLGASRVMYSEVEADDAHFVVHRDYTDGVPSIAGRHRLDDFGPAFVRDHRAGRTLVVTDSSHDERLGQARQAAFAAARIRAFVGVPLVKGGRLAASLSVHFPVPHDWSAAEVALIEEVAERTWEAVERARAEAALRESEEKYRELFETMDEGFALCELVRDEDGRPVDYRYLELNSALVRHADISPDALRGRRANEVFPDLDPWLLETYTRVVATGESVVAEHHYPHVDRWFRINAFPRGGDQFAVLYSDVTERKRGEQALRDSEERFRLFAEAASDVLWIRSADDLQWEYLSPAFETIYGRERTHALRGNNLEHWADFILPEDREHALAQIERVRRGERVTFEYRIRRPDGEVRWLRNTDFPMVDGAGNIRRIAGIGRDVTEQKQVEEELEARIAAATVELRNLSRRLLQVQEEERQHIARELHDEIGQSLTALQLQIVAGRAGGEALIGARQLLAEITQRVSSLSMRLRPAALDTLGLVPAVVALGHRFGEQSGIDVDVRHDGADRRFTPEVEIAAYRVIQEALTNAARYAKTNRVDVRLSADDSVLTLTIRDHGTGFDAAGADRSGGLGGMRERIDLVGGQFTVESGLTDGTVIAAEIPLDRSASIDT